MVLEVITPLIVYMLPIFFFIYMGAEVLLRNSRKTEHRLVAIIIGCYALLLTEEFVRYCLPIEYSPVLVAMWFGNVGVIIPSLLMHFLFKFSGFDRTMPRYVYPYVLYAPVLLILLTIIGGDNIINSQQFVEVGLWKVPVYNTPYYVTITIANIINLIFIYILLKGKSRTTSKEKKEIFNLLMYAVLFVLLWDIIFGYINFGGNLPPYPFLMAGAIWCFLLRIAMIRYDFLNFSSKRYEILFNLNPAAIVLIDTSGSMREANPSAKQLFYDCDLSRMSFYEFLLPEDKQIWVQKFSDDMNQIINWETTITTGNRKLDVLVDGEYVLVENDPHYILILRDITLQKENQREITYMAYHDPLTRLPNRRYFYEKLEEAIQQADVEHRQLAVIVLDLDLFKETNDKFGHHVGDKLLQHVAKIIKEAVTNNGIAARLGGDEFVIFLDQVASVTSVEESMMQLHSRFKEELFIHEDMNIPIQLSTGLSFYPKDGIDSDTLVNHADRTMYQVKRAGGNDYKITQ